MSYKLPQNEPQFAQSKGKTLQRSVQNRRKLTFASNNRLMALLTFKTKEK
jgi:hypothetical protein